VAADGAALLVDDVAGDVGRAVVEPAVEVEEVRLLVLEVRVLLGVDEAGLEEEPPEVLGVDMGADGRVAYSPSAAA
jgi:hypothetical protein